MLRPPQGRNQKKPGSDCRFAQFRCPRMRSISFTWQLAIRAAQDFSVAGAIGMLSSSASLFLSGLGVLAEEWRSSIVLAYLVPWRSASVRLRCDSLGRCTSFRPAHFVDGDRPLSNETYNRRSCLSSAIAAASNSAPARATSTKSASRRWRTRWTRGTVTSA